jgi:transcriptional regulator with XRE-family HTH domain
MLEPNEKLRAARQQNHWSQERAAAEIGIDRKTYLRLENGYNYPQPGTLELVCKRFGLSAEDLGFLALSQPDKRIVVVTSTLEPAPISVMQSNGHELFPKEEFEALCIDLEFRVQCIIYQALSRQLSLHELRRKLASALERSTTMDFERRKLLRHLALLPIQAFGLNMLGGASRSFAPEDILTHCAAGITACEHLSRGIDLHLAYTAISAYVPTLKSLARNSLYRKEASELIAQAMLLLAALGLHLEGSKSAIGYAQQAISYSEASGDIELLLTSLGQLAWIFSSDKQYHKALEKAQFAEHLLKNAKGVVHPLVQSNTYAVVGAYSAQNGHRDEALTALNMATQTFFSTTPADEFSYMDYDYSEIALTWGLAHARTGHPEEALNSFAEIVDLTTLATRMPVSERVRVEFLNHMALAAVKSASKDREQTVKYWQAGMEGAKTLQSEQRFSEALTTYEVMEGVWSGDRRITDLRELVVHW